MKTTLIILGVLVAIVVIAAVIVIVIGSRLPSGHVASRSIRLARPPAEVYALLRDAASFPKWRKDVQRVEMLGAAQFREHGSHGPVTYEVVEDAPNRKLVTRIVDKDLGYSGSWTYDLAADGGGTLLRITENGEVSNPMFRFLSRYVFGHTATMEGVLGAAAAHFGEKAAIGE